MKARTLLGLWTFFLASGVALAQTKVCSLLTAAELEAALGGKAGALTEGTLGPAKVCNASVGKTKVTIRVAQRTSTTGDTESKGVEMMRKAGGQVEVKTEGELTCSTLVPPPSMAQVGYNTTCTILREGVVVGVEVAATSQADMAKMEAVKGLVQKARSRM
jgi:hypothetical protein